MKAFRNWLLLASTFIPILVPELYAASAQAGGYPDKPVTIISDAAPGSTPDVDARFVAKGLSKTWGQQVIVVNHPGANGSIAARAAAESPADGYTLYMPALSSFVARTGVAVSAGGGGQNRLLRCRNNAVALPAPRFRRVQERQHQPRIERVAGLIRHKAATNRRACERQIADGVEQFMAHEFVFVTQPFRVHDAARVNDNGIRQRSAEAQTIGAQHFDVGHKTERPRLGDVL